MIKAQTDLEIGQWYWCNGMFQSGGPSHVHCSSINTCSKNSPLILSARQTDREIDDCVGKSQPGEKLTCKWWRVREGRSRGRGDFQSVDASRGDVCGVSSWQLSSYTTCVPGKERGKPLLSSLFKTTSHWLPDAVAMALGCSGNWHRHTLQQREKTVGGCHLNWGRMQLSSISSSLSFCPPLLWSSSPLSLLSGGC